MIIWFLYFVGHEFHNDITDIFTMYWLQLTRVILNPKQIYYSNKLNNSDISKMCFHFDEIVKAKFDPGRLKGLYLNNASYARMICSMNIVRIIMMHLEALKRWILSKVKVLQNLDLRFRIKSYHFRWIQLNEIVCKIKNRFLYNYQFLWYFVPLCLWILIISFSE